VRRLVPVLIAVVTGVGAEGARADEPSQTAQELFDAGRALLAEGKPAEACQRFEAVLKLEPEDVGATLNLGLCNELRGRLATALRWFRRAQVHASELKLAETEAAAKAKTSAIAERVPTLKLVVAPGLHATLDGTPVDDIELARVEVDAGHHVITAGPVTRAIDIADGERQTVELALPKPPPPAARRTVQIIDRGQARRRLAYIVGGVGGGLVLGASTLGLVGRHAASTSEHPDTQLRWQQTLRYGGTSLFVIGGAAVASAAWLYLTAPGKQIVEHAYVKLGPDATAAGVSGAF